MIHDKQVSIHPSIVVWILFGILTFYFAYLVLSVLAIFFMGLVLSAAMEPAVRRMKKSRVPRFLSVSILYGVLIVAIGIFLAYLIPVIVSQAQDFSQNFPEYLNKFPKASSFMNDMFRNGSLFGSSNSGNGINSLMEGIFSTTVGVFHGFISIIAVFAIAFYLSIEEDGMKRFVSSVVPARYQEYAVSRTQIIYEKIGYWMLGQFLLMFMIFILYFALLSVLDVPYAFTLALIAGFLEIIPYIGPMLSAIPSLILAFTVSPIAGITVAIGYVIIQQAESHFLIPQVMKRAVGLHPVAVILALLIGAKIGGVVGAILAVPVATALSVFVRDALEKQQSDVVVN